MADKYVSLPLYSDADYEYDVNLEGNYYTIRIYLNERVGGWFIDIRDGENQMLVAGERIVTLFPVLGFYRQLPNLTGFFWLEPKGDYANEILSNPSELSQYFRFYYTYTDNT